MIEDAATEASRMAQTRHRKSPRKSKLAEQFEAEGFALEDTEYEVLAPRGEHFDLRRLLARVDRAYFGANRPFTLPEVGWAPLDAHNAWAVYVLKDDRILIEKSLDTAETPAFVIEYLLMHEMLHLVHPPDDLEGEPEWHNEPFEASIARFERGEEAERWLDRRLDAELRSKRRRAARGSDA
jgi:predicted metal-dependent hydrolase